MRCRRLSSIGRAVNIASSPGGGVGWRQGREWGAARMNWCMASKTTKRSNAGWLFPFLSLNVLVLLLTSCRYLTAGSVPETAPAVVFLALMAVGHLTTLAGLCLAPAYVLDWFSPRSRVALFVGTAGMVALELYLAIDTCVFRLYRFHINASVVAMLSGGAAGDIFVFSGKLYAQLLGLGVLVVAAESVTAVLLWRADKRAPRVRHPRSWLIPVVAVLVAHHLFFALADARSYVPVLQQARLLPAYYPLTLRHFFRRIGLAVPAPARDRLGIAGNDNSLLRYPLHAMECAGPGERTNILVIVIDSWRYDMLSREVTPALSTFAAGAANFENHTSGGSATRTGIFTLFYGLTANYWHPFLHERRGPVLISEALRLHYQMGVFGSAALTSPEFDQTVFADVPNLRLRSEDETAYRRDEEITDGFINFLSRRDPSRPFLGFLFYDAPHAFSVPPNFDLAFRPSLDAPDFLALNESYDPMPFLNLYKNSVRFDDGLIARVLASLDASGEAERTVVIVTGDHGQEFNENGKNYWGHSGNFSRYQIGVPFVLRWPGRKPRTYSHPTNHIDLAPTLLREVFHCNNGSDDYTFGDDLFDETRRAAFLVGNYDNEAIIQTDRITLIRPYSGLEEVDLRLNPLLDQHHDPDLIRQYLTMRSAFFKR